MSTLRTRNGPAVLGTVALSRRGWRILRATVGLVTVIMLWWLLAATVFRAGHAVATPPQVVRQLIHDGWSFYWPNTWATLKEAGLGFLYGNAGAIVCGVAVILVPILEGPAVMLALATYCMPVMAVGPILVLVFSGRAPMIALAALSVFFTTVVGTILGLRAADPLALDLVRAYGGGRWQQLRKVRLTAALPALLSALKIATPAAFLGAIIGEWLGATDTGLGIALVSSEQHLEAARTWGITLLCAAIPSLAYALIALIGRWLTPWAKDEYASGAGVSVTASDYGALRTVRRALALGAALVAMAVLSAAVWVAFLHLWNVSALVGKTPVDVWRFLISAPDAAMNRHQLTTALLVTLRDAGTGFGLGIVGGAATAILFVVWEPLEQALMAVAMFARTVPFAVLTPLIALVVGRGLGAVMIVSGMIVFFPVLVNVAFGLRSASTQATDLVRAYGGGKWMVLGKVALPSALPAFFASVRLSVPAALVGGLVAEWEVTGKGLGYLMVSDVSSFDYTELWAGAVIVTLVSLFIYGVASGMEAGVMRLIFGHSSSSPRTCAGEAALVPA